MNFEKLTFSDIKSNELVIILEQYLEENHQQGWVPVYRFKIMDIAKNVVGGIEFRAGITELLKDRDGHIGYHINEPYRGNKYSLKALKMILPFIWEHPIKELVLTTDIENNASEKILKLLGARFLKINNDKKIYVYQRNI